jgi:fission process protein 1
VGFVGESDVSDVVVNSKERSSTRHVTHSYPFKYQIPFDSMASTETVVQAAHGKVSDLAERNVDTTESDIRYLAYAARLRTALRASSRYIAYVSATFLPLVHPHTLEELQTSDIGEAFRPVVPPWVVTAAYGVSWLYLSG